MYLLLQFLENGLDLNFRIDKGYLRMV